jgi:hypothetical protein
MHRGSSERLQSYVSRKTRQAMQIIARLHYEGGRQMIACRRRRLRSGHQCSGLTKPTGHAPGQLECTSAGQTSHVYAREAASLTTALITELSPGTLPPPVTIPRCVGCTSLLKAGTSTRIDEFAYPVPETSRAAFAEVRGLCGFLPIFPPRRRCESSREEYEPGPFRRAQGVHTSRRPLLL